MYASMDVITVAHTLHESSVIVLDKQVEADRFLSDLLRSHLIIKNNEDVQADLRLGLSSQELRVF